MITTGTQGFLGLGVLWLEQTANNTATNFCVPSAIGSLTSDPAISGRIPCTPSFPHGRDHSILCSCTTSRSLGCTCGGLFRQRRGATFVPKNRCTSDRTPRVTNAEGSIPVSDRI